MTALARERAIEVVTTPAARTTPSRVRGGFLWHMPRWLRLVLTFYSFAMFFGGSLTIGLVVLVMQALSRDTPERRRHFTRRLNASMAHFSGFMRDTGLIDYWPPVLPEELRGKTFLLIANHPTLIDVVLVLSALPELSSVAKASWYRSFFMGAMLRRTEYVPGPGHDQGSDEDAPAMKRIADKLREGVSVLAFPEGTRSYPDRLQRFRRGAIEAAVQAGVPILPLFIANDQPFLTKGTPPWKPPKTTVRFDFEWLGVVETKGRESRELTRELAARYEARYAKLLHAAGIRRDEVLR